MDNIDKKIFICTKMNLPVNANNFVDINYELTFEEFGLDELDFIALLIECEKEYNIKFFDDEIFSGNKFSQLIELIKNKTK